MDLSYQQPQSYSMYENHHWQENFKSAYAQREHGVSCEERLSTSASPADFDAVSQIRKPSMLKVEDERSVHEAMWHDRSHETQQPTRHYSQSSLPTHAQQHHPSYMRIDPNFAASYAQPQWSIPPSGTSTPTTAYHGVDTYGQPVQYAAHPVFNFNQDPASAVSMSPQSSQGGWASATSSDGIEHRSMIHSPTYRPASPQLVLRPDGIRKKNARFEIPKERNLATIDAMIHASTDENEKKELKQQKRLLRNRQAALDSRQRKKSHTEKLELEKKVHESTLRDAESTVEQLEHQLQMERDQWNHQRQQYEMQLQQMLQESSEAIRVKTIEAADCRRQMNAMKEYIREQQVDQQSQQANGYGQASEMNNMASDFGEFSVIDDEWENEFSLIDNHDFETTELDSLQQQATPKPSTSSTMEKGTDAEFGWSTFYMCLLFGAVVVSAGGQLAKLANNSTNVSLPAVSDEFRADAENVLKAVVSSNPQSAHGMVPSRSAITSTPRTTVHATDLSQSSSLDRLSSSLSTPSRYQQVQQAFAMTPASYNHIVNPLAGFEDDAEADLCNSPKRSRLEEAMATLNARKSEVEKHGLYSRASERSALHVPDAILDELRDFYHSTRSEVKQE